MPKKTGAELSKADMIQTIRTIKRLQHNIQLRHELNEIEAQAIQAFEQALLKGKAYKLDIKSVLADEL